MLKPIVIKNIPNNIPRIGLTNDSILCLYFDSESNNPAKKAPKVSDNPTVFVRKDIDKTTNKVKLKNDSCELLFDT